MQSSGKRRAIIRNNGVVAGSVWDTRIKMDEVEGGVKVFNGGGDARRDEEGMRVYRRLRRNQSDTSAAKRRNWKPPEPAAITASPPQLRKARSELSAPPKIVDDDDDDEIDIEVDDKEIDVPVEKPAAIPETPISPPAENKSKDSEEEKEDVVESSSITEAQNRMQNIVDLVMWRDVSKSAFVFGFGIFVLCSSSYAKDLNFSLVSAVSYLGLAYLAVIFLYKSILRRGSTELEGGDGGCVIGEEEAVWVLRFLLPYVNEVMLKMRGLFSGDPATTMKLALLLFVLARCGGSITTWTLAKLVFFGVFTIPKLFSSYSVQLAKYGKFWIQRFRDWWESCTHKKAAAAAVFTLIWNLSSTVARIWSVFMLVVAVKLYQQCVLEEQWSSEEDASSASTSTTTKDREKEYCNREEDSNFGRSLVQHRQRRVVHVDREEKLKKRT